MSTEIVDRSKTNAKGLNWKH